VSAATGALIGGVIAKLLIIILATVVAGLRRFLVALIVHQVEAITAGITLGYALNQQLRFTENRSHLWWFGCASALSIYQMTIWIRSLVMPVIS
jgi:hypothetical protein